MTNITDDPKKVYSQIRDNLDSILRRLDTPSDDEAVTNACQTSKRTLMSLRSQVSAQVARLEKNAEWDTFTMAFYGETNAGKSTIIEVLRILFREQTKITEQHLFDSEKTSYDAIGSQILTNEHECAENELHAKNASEEEEKIFVEHQNAVIEFSRQETVAKNEDFRLREIIKQKKRKASLWGKILHFFKKIPEENNVVLIEEQLASVQNSITSEKHKYEGKLATIKKTLEEIKQVRDAGKAKYNELKKRQVEIQGKLEKLQDGGIIGDGRSDYTRATKRYDFAVGNLKFAILDIPGIEGKEKEVIEEVQNAVQKAHAVFYVTSKPTTPQKGDDGGIGTLEKIKEHLGDQTEVWTIFNKRAKNPLALHDTLVSAEESKSLKILDDRLREQLGQHYRGTISLSAFPAFLAVAKCFSPAGEFQKSKEKFLKKNTPDELLSHSGAQSFGNFIRKQLFDENHSKKIKCSNLNKANEVLKKTITTIADEKERISDLRDTCAKNLSSTKRQLSYSFKGLQQRMKNCINQLLDNFQWETRKKIYADIEKDIENDVAKERIELYIKQETEILKSALAVRIKEELEKFEDDVADKIKNFERYINDLSKLFNAARIGKSLEKYEIKMDMESGIQWWKLIISCGVSGIVLVNSWNPIGWIGAILLSIGTLLGIWNSIRCFFSTEYKISQQKKTANENIENIKSEIESSLKKNMDNEFPKIETMLTDTKTKLRQVVDMLARIGEEMSQAAITLEQLSFNIINQIQRKHTI
jgi:hypothetical protein